MPFARQLQKTEWGAPCAARLRQTRADVAALAQRIAPGTFILVGGQARSGKSTYAQVLRQALEMQARAAVVVALDGWIRGLTERVAEQGFWGRHDRGGMARALAAIRHSAGIHYLPVYDRQRRGPGLDRMRIEVGAASVIIAEGVSALADPAIAAGADLRIFVRCAEAIRRRRLVDDYLARGFSATAVAALLESRMRDEFALVERGLAIAHHVVTIS